MIYLVVVVEVEGIKCCILLDIGVGSLYVFVVFLDRILSIGYKKEVWKIEMLLGALIREVELVIIIIFDVNRKFLMFVEVIKVDKGELFILENLKY